MSGFVARVDRHGFIRDWDGPPSTLGWMAVDLVGRQFAVLGPGLETVREALREGVPKRTTAAIVRADGSPVNAEVVVAPAGRWGRRGAWIVGTVRPDESGLVSREAFSAAVAGALADRRAPAVVMIEASGVDAVNQIVGHAAGDELLRQVGERLVRALPGGALATRYASRFIVLLLDGSAADLAALGRALAAAVDGPVATGPAVVGVDVNVGASGATPGDDSAALLRNAEVALMAAHVTGARAEVYDPEVHHDLEVRLERELGLRSAVDRGEFEVHYQPVVDLRDQQLVGAEALIRWRRRSGEMVMPTDFIDLAESSGAIIRIGLWTLHEACGQMQAWNDAYRPDRPLEVAVNLSVRQLGSAALISDIAGVILGVGIDPRSVTLEVTESSFMDNAEGMIRRLGQLRTMGLTLSMDDFGTGYSSLSYLRDLPVDIVKIDRSFVGGVARSDEEWALVTAIIRLAKSLGKRTLAEGVETAAQLAHLRALGCDLAQGYLFGRPLPAEEFEILLAGGGRVVG